MGWMNLRGITILILLSFNFAFAKVVYEPEIWQYAEDYFALLPNLEGNEVTDITISDKYSLRNLSRSKYRFEVELRRVSQFLKEFSKEVERHPSKTKFNELTIERNKVLLNKNKSIDRVEQKQFSAALSKIATAQGNLLIGIEKWKLKLASAYQIVIRLNANGERLNQIDFIRPSRAFFQRAKIDSSLLVQYSY